jgi:hypothetical protein
MSARLERFLARLYTDAAARAAFHADPAGVARHAGLDPREVAAVEKIDRLGLAMTATSLTRKRQARAPGPLERRSDPRLRSDDPY